MAEIAQPLTELTKKNEPFVWTPVHDKAFEKSKSKFSEELILKIYKFGLPTCIIIDASNVATGGVLEQKHEDNYWHPVTYRSSLMSKEERNYPIYDREMLGLIHALEDWQHFLKGLPCYGSPLISTQFLGLPSYVHKVTCTVTCNVM